MHPKARNAVRQSTAHRAALTAMLAVAIVLPALADEPTVGTKKGHVYPNFYLPRLDGTMGRLSDYRGQKVLLIHFASW